MFKPLLGNFGRFFFTRLALLCLTLSLGLLMAVSPASANIDDDRFF